MELVGISSLVPSSTVPANTAFRSLVTLIWPFSSVTGQCALLLADPDFRKRYHKGQVRVRFAGHVARAIGASKIGIGDEVELGLEGATWVTEDDGPLVKTPGRGLEGELIFKGKVKLIIRKEDQEERLVQLDEPVPTSTEASNEHAPSTPASRSSRRSGFGIDDFGVAVYSSPAFMSRLRRLEASAGKSPRTLATEDRGLDDVTSRKKRRVSYKNVTEWKFDTREPSPEKQAVESTTADVTEKDREDAEMEEVQEHAPKGTGVLNNVSEAQGQTATREEETIMQGISLIQPEEVQEARSPAILEGSIINQDNMPNLSNKSQAMNGVENDLSQRQYAQVPEQIEAGEASHQFAGTPIPGEVQGGRSATSYSDRRDGEDETGADLQVSEPAKSNRVLKTAEELVEKPVEKPVQESASEPAKQGVEEVGEDNAPVPDSFEVEDDEEETTLQTPVAKSPSMPPPPLPRLQLPETPRHVLNGAAVSVSGETTPIQSENPLTPRLEPVGNDNLPLPSPFPGSAQQLFQSSPVESRPSPERLETTTSENEPVSTAEPEERISTSSVPVKITKFKEIDLPGSDDTNTVQVIEYDEQATSTALDTEANDAARQITPDLEPQEPEIVEMVDSDEASDDDTIERIRGVPGSTASPIDHSIGTVPDNISVAEVEVDEAATADPGSSGMPTSQDVKGTSEVSEISVKEVEPSSEPDRVIPDTYDGLELVQSSPPQELVHVESSEQKLRETSPRDVDMSREDLHSPSQASDVDMLSEGVYDEDMLASLQASDESEQGETPDLDLLTDDMKKDIDPEDLKALRAYDNDSTNSDELAHDSDSGQSEVSFIEASDDDSDVENGELFSDDDAESNVLPDTWGQEEFDPSGKDSEAENVASQVSPAVTLGTPAFPFGLDGSSYSRPVEATTLRPSEPALEIPQIAPADEEDAWRARDDAIREMERGQPNLPVPASPAELPHIQVKDEPSINPPSSSRSKVAIIELSDSDDDDDKDDADQTWELNDDSDVNKVNEGPDMGSIEQPEDELEELYEHESGGESQGFEEGPSGKESEEESQDGLVETQQQSDDEHLSEEADQDRNEDLQQEMVKGVDEGIEDSMVDKVNKELGNTLEPAKTKKKTDHFENKQDLALQTEVAASTASHWAVNDLAGSPERTQTLLLNSQSVINLEEGEDSSTNGVGAKVPADVLRPIAEPSIEHRAAPANSRFIANNASIEIPMANSGQETVSTVGRSSTDQALAALSTALSSGIPDPVAPGLSKQRLGSPEGEPLQHPAVFEHDGALNADRSPSNFDMDDQASPAASFIEGAEFDEGPWDFTSKAEIMDDGDAAQPMPKYNVFGQALDSKSHIPSFPEAVMDYSAEVGLQTFDLPEQPEGSDTDAPVLEPASESALQDAYDAQQLTSSSFMTLSSSSPAPRQRSSYAEPIEEIDLSQVEPDYWVPPSYSQRTYTTQRTEPIPDSVGSPATTLVPGSSRQTSRISTPSHEEGASISFEDTLQNRPDAFFSQDLGSSQLQVEHVNARKPHQSPNLDMPVEEDEWIFDCTVCGLYGKKFDDGTHSIACSTCNVWQHSRCHGISMDVAERDDYQFLCQNCVGKGEGAQLLPTDMQEHQTRFAAGSTESTPPPQTYGLRLQTPNEQEMHVPVFQDVVPETQKSLASTYVQDVEGTTVDDDLLADYGRVSQEREQDANMIDAPPPGNVVVDLRETENQDRDETMSDVPEVPKKRDLWEEHGAGDETKPVPDSQQSKSSSQKSGNEEEKSVTALERLEIVSHSDVKDKACVSVTPQPKFPVQSVAEEGRERLGPQQADISLLTDAKSYTKQSNELLSKSPTFGEQTPSPTSNAGKGHISPTPQPIVDLSPHKKALKQVETPLLSEPASVQTPAHRRESLASRTWTENRMNVVPAVISAWFTPRRSSGVLTPSRSRQQNKGQTPAKTPSTGPSKLQPQTSCRRSISPPTINRLASQGTSTSLSYFHPLAAMEKFVNQPSVTVDVFAVSVEASALPTQAKAGRRDFYTMLHVIDPSLQEYNELSKKDTGDGKEPGNDMRVECFRPWKASLPSTDAGDVVLLRSFVVKSQKHRGYLTSGEESSWCVWRFSASASQEQSGSDDMFKPIWAKRRANNVREEIRGPPMDIGQEEREKAISLRKWWEELQVAKGQVAEVAVDDENAQDQEMVG